MSHRKWAFLCVHSIYRVFVWRIGTNWKCYEDVSWLFKLICLSETLIWDSRHIATHYSAIQTPCIPCSYVLAFKRVERAKHTIFVYKVWSFVDNMCIHIIHSMSFGFIYRLHRRFALNWFRFWCWLCVVLCYFNWNNNDNWAWKTTPSPAFKVFAFKHL